MKKLLSYCTDEKKSPDLRRVSEGLGELIKEILDAFRPSVDADNWEQPKAVIHECHESAIAIFTRLKYNLNITS